jgi:hypothetical protein
LFPLPLFFSSLFVTTSFAPLFGLLPCLLSLVVPELARHLDILFDLSSIHSQSSSNSVWHSFINPPSSFLTANSPLRRERYTHSLNRFEQPTQQRFPTEGSSQEPTYRGNLGSPNPPQSTNNPVRSLGNTLSLKRLHDHACKYTDSRTGWYHDTQRRLIPQDFFGLPGPFVKASIGFA